MTTQTDPIAHALAWLEDMADPTNEADALAAETLRAAVRASKNVARLLGVALSSRDEVTSEGVWAGPDFVTVDREHGRKVLRQGDPVAVALGSSASGGVTVSGPDWYPHTVPTALLGHVLGLGAVRLVS